MDYQFAKLGTDKPVPKLSYAKVFTPWGWWLGTGIYIEDVEAAFRAAVVNTGIFVALATGLLGWLGWAINRSVQQQIGGEPAVRRIGSSALPRGI